jgi:aldehyde dehydrogenase (NAD+)
VPSRAGRPPLADTLTAEILPLLEAARYLERRAEALLAPRRLGESGRPLWLAGTDQIVLREPWGAILILAPSNYPIMLPGIQALQALVAGNAVAWKPGRGGAPASRAIGALLVEAGLPPDLLDVTADDDETGRSLAASGFDRIVLTGSAATGRGVLAAAAANLTPCTMELSGADPVYVLPGADFASMEAPPASRPAACSPAQRRSPASSPCS